MQEVMEKIVDFLSILGGLETFYHILKWISEKLLKERLPHPNIGLTY